MNHQYFKDPVLKEAHITVCKVLGIRSEGCIKTIKYVKKMALKSLKKLNIHFFINYSRREFNPILSLTRHVRGERLQQAADPARAGGGRGPGARARRRRRPPGGDAPAGGGGAQGRPQPGARRVARLETCAYKSSSHSLSGMDSSCTNSWSSLLEGSSGYRASLTPQWSTDNE